MAPMLSRERCIGGLGYLEADCAGFRARIEVNYSALAEQRTDVAFGIALGCGQFVRPLHFDMGNLGEARGSCFIIFGQRCGAGIAGKGSTAKFGRPFQCAVFFLNSAGWAATSPALLREETGQSAL